VKLAHFDLDSVLELVPGKVNVLVVEDEQLFWNYCNQLYSQINGGEGGFCLSDKEENLSFSQNCFFVWDYFSLPVNDKKTVGKLYKSLQEIAQNSFPQEYDALCTAFATFFSKLNSQSDCAITYNMETGVANLFKAFDVALEGADSLLESLCLFLQSKAHFFGTKCFFMCNLKTVLSKQQLAQLYREAELWGICLFLLENTVKEKLPHETLTIIDRDLCEILA